MGLGLRLRTCRQLLFGDAGRFKGHALVSDVHELEQGGAARVRCARVAVAVRVRVRVSVRVTRSSVNYMSLSNAVRHECAAQG